MGIVAQGPGDIQPTGRRRPGRRAGDGALTVDVDIRLRSRGLVVTRGQIAAALAALGALIAWAVSRLL
jgi:hypothetical protein